MGNALGDGGAHANSRWCPNDGETRVVGEENVCGGLAGVNGPWEARQHRTNSVSRSIREKKTGDQRGREGAQTIKPPVGVTRGGAEAGDGDRRTRCRTVSDASHLVKG